MLSSIGEEIRLGDVVVYAILSICALFPYKLFPIQTFPKVKVKVEKCSQKIRCNFGGKNSRPEKSTMQLVISSQKFEVKSFHGDDLVI